MDAEATQTAPPAATDTGGSTITAPEPKDTGETVQDWLGELNAQARRAAPEPAAQEQPAEPAKPATAPVPPAEKKPVSMAHEKFRERQQKRQQAAEGGRIAELQRERDEAWGIIKEALGGVDPRAAAGGEQPAPRAQAKDDPEPNFYADPKAWHEWNRRETQRDLAAKVDPILAQQQEETRAAEQQRVQRERVQRVVQDLKQAEDDYVETDEGKGFPERVDTYQDVYRTGLVELVGLPPEAAEHVMRAHLNTIVNVATRSGLNPAAVLDRMMQLNDLVALTLYGDDGAAAAAPAAPARPATPERARRELEGLATAAAAPEAHSLGERNSTSTPERDDLASRARAGRLDTNTLAAALARRGYTGSNMHRGALDFLEELDRG